MVTKERKASPRITCPVSSTVKVIGGKWKPTILYYLMSGPQRFNELQRLTGNPSARILTSQLRELEADKVVKRKIYDQIPPKVEYSMTAKGQSLSKILNLMALWSLEHQK